MRALSALAIPAVLLLPPWASRGAPTAARTRAREVLKAARCDKCHDSSVNADNAQALAVYDLASEGWPATMKDAQLPKLLSRLKSAAAADQQAVREFIRNELASRAARRH